MYVDPYAPIPLAAKCPECCEGEHDQCPLLPGCSCCDDTLMQMLDSAPAQWRWGTDGPFYPVPDYRVPVDPAQEMECESCQ